jgi:hypothetical protein
MDIVVDIINRVVVIVAVGFGGALIIARGIYWLQHMWWDWRDSRKLMRRKSQLASGASGEVVGSSPASVAHRNEETLGSGAALSEHRDGWLVIGAAAIFIAGLFAIFGKWALLALFAIFGNWTLLALPAFAYFLWSFWTWTTKRTGDENEKS